MKKNALTFIPITEKATWDGLTQSGSSVPQPQSWPYGEALQLTTPYTPLRFIIQKNGLPIGGFQLFQRTFFFGAFQLTKLQRGPFWTHEKYTRYLPEVVSFLENTYKKGPLTQLSLLLEAPSSFSGHMQQMKYTALGSTYQTHILDLTQPLETLQKSLHPKWRNQLILAQKKAPRISVVSRPHAKDSLIQKFSRLKWKKRFTGPSKKFLKAHLSISRSLHLQSRTSSGSISAETLFDLHGKTATYFLGWTSDQGRKEKAMNALLWEGIKELKEQGITHLDIGGTSFKNTSLNRFKKRIGGAPITLPPTFVK